MKDFGYILGISYLYMYTENVYLSSQYILYIRHLYLNKNRLTIHLPRVLYNDKKYNYNNSSGIFEEEINKVELVNINNYNLIQLK